MTGTLVYSLAKNKYAKKPGAEKRHSNTGILWICRLSLSSCFECWPRVDHVLTQVSFGLSFSGLHAYFFSSPLHAKRAVAFLGELLSLLSGRSLADIGSVLLIAIVLLQIQIKNSNLLKSTLTNVIRIMQRTSQSMHIGWWSDLGSLSLRILCHDRTFVIADIYFCVGSGDMCRSWIPNFLSVTDDRSLSSHRSLMIFEIQETSEIPDHTVSSYSTLIPSCTRVSIGRIMPWNTGCGGALLIFWPLGSKMLVEIVFMSAPQDIWPKVRALQWQRLMRLDPQPRCGSVSNTITLAERQSHHLTPKLLTCQ